MEFWLGVITAYAAEFILLFIHSLLGGNKNG